MRKKWKIRTNKELNELYGEQSIINMMNKTYKMAETYCKNGSRRPKEAISGRRRTEWLQSVKKDLEEVGIREWHKGIGDRKEWRRICNQAMGLLGSEC